MPAKITAGDAYHKLKLRWPDCLLAFGVGFMIEFVRSDARDVARLLQESVDNPAGYDSVVIHSGKFFTALRRLNLMGNRSLCSRGRPYLKDGVFLSLSGGLIRLFPRISQGIRPTRKRRGGMRGRA